MQDEIPLTGDPNKREGPPPFSRFWTVLSATIVFTGLGVFIWIFLTLSPLDHIQEPERGLELLAGRTMDLETALTDVSKWERLVYQVPEGNTGSLQQIKGWYQELSDQARDPLTELYIGVLEAEVGDEEQLQRRIQSWENRPSPFPHFVGFLQTGYLGKVRSPQEIETLQAYLAEEVPDNWFYSQLAIRLAKRGGDPLLESMTQDRLEARSQELLWRTRILTFVEILGCLAGLLVMGVFFRKWVRHGPGMLKVSDGSLPAIWPIRNGIAVVLRGGAISVLFLVGLSFVQLDVRYLELLSIPIIHLPVLALGYRYLLLPYGIPVVQAFGFRIVPGMWGRLWAAAAGLFALGIMGDWLLGLGASVAGLSIHWTNWFAPSLVWGSTLDVMVTLGEYVVLAPVLEELIFRGLVFATLRRKFGWGTSAIISAAIFAGAHGYVFLGFVTVFWSGLLWAWAYEKTGSLFPGMIAHGLNNLLVSLSMLAMFR